MIFSGGRWQADAHENLKLEHEETISLTQRKRNVGIHDWTRDDLFELIVVFWDICHRILRRLDVLFIYISTETLSHNRGPSGASFLTSLVVLFHSDEDARVARRTVFITLTSTIKPFEQRG
jgi:hypothetical protein